LARYQFTSESVTEGHPDKLCDQISDAILDFVLTEDKNGRVAIETLVTRGMALVAGELTTTCYVPIPRVVREVIRDAGYTRSEYGFEWEDTAVLTSIQEQSPDIALGVDKGGAGDQGLMFGYAVNETPELMPLPIMLAHRLVRRLSEVRRAEDIPNLRPDGKSQVTVEYENGRPERVSEVIISANHDEEFEIERLRELVVEKIIEHVIPEEMRRDTDYLINPTGKFVIGGPVADTGLTGRKIMVDTYGGYSRHGGGCFSGKDPTKVDRSASYMARYVAKNIVAAGLANACEIQLAYAIGRKEPVSVSVKVDENARVPGEEILKAVRKRFDLTPGGIIAALDLLKPIYRNTAAFGHFGREEEGFTWERTDAADDLKELVHG
jgi:S-adenosylmethionine synthetase